MSLKENIRDLEAALQREREFNASDRKLNAEYLTNVIQKFLLSDSAEEKGKLASVICTILHFKPDVSSTINKKWLPNRRGLVGWLLPLPPPETNDPDNLLLYDPNKDGMASYGNY